MEKNYISISELAKTLGITYQGALKKLRTKQDQLKEYLVLDEKKNIKGIKQEGLEELRNLPTRVSYASKVAQEESKQQAIINQRIENLEEIIKTQKDFIEELKKDKEEQKAKIISLESELNALRGSGLLGRLLGYKK